MEPFVLRAVRPVPRLGIQAGDRVVWQPLDSPFPLLLRDIPNAGAVLYAWKSGALEAVTPSPRPEELRAAVGFPSLSSSRPRRARRHGVPGHLALIR